MEEPPREPEREPEEPQKEEQKDSVTHTLDRPIFYGYTTRQIVTFLDYSALVLVLLLASWVFIFSGGTKVVQNNFLCSEQAPVLKSVQTGASKVVECQDLLNQHSYLYNGTNQSFLN